MTRGDAVGRASKGAVLRGLVLVVVAVLLGLVLLNGTDEQVIGAEGQAPEVVVAPTAPDTGAGRAAGATDPDAPVDDAADVDATDVEGEVTDDDGKVTGTTTVDPDGAGVAPGEGATAEPTTTTTTAPAGPRPPEELTVLVANGSGLQGAAASVTETLDGAGYQTAAPSNLAGGTRANASVVYFTEGFEAEAEAMAAAFDPVPPVAPMPVPAPLDDLRGASVVLVLGPDLVEG